MQTLRQISAATILSLTLAISVLAGHIETPGAVAPAPTSTTNVTTSIVLTILSVIYP
jgi:hypothetical protein